jgi:hypothetical protein
MAEDLKLAAIIDYWSHKQDGFGFFDYALYCRVKEVKAQKILNNLNNYEEASNQTSKKG